MILKFKLGVVVTNLHDREVLSAIVEGYMRNQNLGDGIKYGLMMVGVCEKLTMNGYILELKGKDLIKKVIQNCNHLDFKTAITASKILVFLV